ncbi:hypothetical protein L249_6491 [Ophiocordyceps polyrhachis-furcata BCC 54312]|uniref:Guanine nucleotide-binding protein subunit gamma n=1 Tax=Ophiocordyceps polyrhachis-furcata BCC 54312 TaxID=1330021 RepID=A0A367LK40_9HYPO|nr:hypothetical protein L249_6491 [Ophiocordyceps polyrhachis-furcata BCC 54312]
MDQGKGPPLPRITIKFCVQCRWMLRAAYYAQELLSTFAQAIGEVALQPCTGGTFVVAVTHRGQQQKATDANTDADTDTDTDNNTTTTILWDRSVDGGFPETKDLKRRLRDVVQPGRNLGHVDGHPRADNHQPNKPQEDEVPTCDDCPPPPPIVAPPPPSSFFAAPAVAMPQYTSRDVGESQPKNKKQSMSDLKLRRLTELNNRLREDLERERIPLSIIAYCNGTRDYMVPSVWGAVPKGDDPYAPQQSGSCCAVMSHMSIRDEFPTGHPSLTCRYTLKEDKSVTPTPLRPNQPRPGQLSKLEAATRQAHTQRVRGGNENREIERDTQKKSGREREGEGKEHDMPELRGGQGESVHLCHVFCHLIVRAKSRPSPILSRRSLGMVKEEGGGEGWVE